jgi:hypothetical protein
VSLNVKELEQHAAELRRKIAEIKELQSRVKGLESELQAVELIIGKERERDHEESVLREPVPGYYGLTIPDAVAKFFANGAGFDWYTGNDVAERLKEQMKSYEYGSLRANIGMALKSMSDAGVLERRNESKNKVPLYAYRKKA